MGNTTFFIVPQDGSQGATTHVPPSLEAVHIYSTLTILATNSYHCVGLKISIVPFALSEFPGQVFYIAEGAFVRCCNDVQQNDVMDPITNAAETIYRTSVSWHKWNFSAPGFWYVAVYWRSSHHADHDAQERIVAHF